MEWLKKYKNIIVITVLIGTYIVAYAFHFIHLQDIKNNFAATNGKITIIAGALAVNIPINANGQRYFWRANANLNNAVKVQGGNNALASVAFFPLNTAGGTVTGRIQIEEI